MSAAVVRKAGRNGSGATIGKYEPVPSRIVRLLPTDTTRCSLPERVKGRWKTGSAVLAHTVFIRERVLTTNEPEVSTGRRDDLLFRAFFTTLRFLVLFAAFFQNTILTGKRKVHN